MRNDWPTDPECEPCRPCCDLDREFADREPAPRDPSPEELEAAGRESLRRILAIAAEPIN